jgi:hypothetical protein
MVQIEFSFGAMADEITVRGHVVRIDASGAALVEIVAEHKARLEHVHGVLRGARESVVRRHKRVAVRLPVVWRIDQHVHRDFTADLSCGGLFILSEQAPPQRRRIELTLSFAPDDALRLGGRVTWAGEARRERGFGVEFERIDRETFARLRNLVRAIETGR